ncbi:methyl-accepting chemotaxis protein [Sinorhizobium alkalisoli]|nr:HAMP domain-containing methyl-accepting chemotaxis protein [Sinorhizobium alkalisoli]
MFEVSTRYSDLLNKDAAATLYLTQANRSLEAARSSISDMMMTRAKEARAKPEAALKDAQTNFLKSMDQAIAAAPGSTELSQLKSDGFSLLNDACGAAIAVGRGAASEAELATVQQLFLSLCQPAFAAISPRFIAVANQMAMASEQKRIDVTQTARTTSVWTLGATAFALLFVSAFGFLAVRSWLVKPIGAIAETMKVIASGDMAATVRGADRRDEIGAMARAVQVFRDNELRARELEESVEASRNTAEKDRARSAEAERIRAQTLAATTAELAEALQQLANRNLAFRLENPFAEDFETLRSDFNAAVGQLSGSLHAVSSATGSIDAGAHELAQSAQDLFRRTEQQAATLEQTAAALDQITQNVVGSSKRTDEARELAVEANRSARRSAEVVRKAVSAMQRIEQSSAEITNIVSVIDEIAFQTNLLALNAGVEAARSGEAGKGFAVVAQEVRELAQRSALAAKDIKDLIHNSALEVTDGVQLVRDTGEVLELIESQILRINSQLDAVAAAANDQSVALAEVNRAVNQMDDVTQQNAAMAEESTAASVALANEVRRLRGIVSGFQLENKRSASLANEGMTDPDGAPRVSPARRMLAVVANALAVDSKTADAPDEVIAPGQ